MNFFKKPPRKKKRKTDTDFQRSPLKQPDSPVIEALRQAMLHASHVSPGSQVTQHRRRALTLQTRQKKSNLEGTTYAGKESASVPRMKADFALPMSFSSQDVECGYKHEESGESIWGVAYKKLIWRLQRCEREEEKSWSSPGAKEPRPPNAVVGSRTAGGGIYII